jgi:hypothetical protein
MNATAERPRQKRNDAAPKRHWRIDEWSVETGCSRATTYRRIADGTLRVRRYGDITLILGFADDESADSAE